MVMDFYNISLHLIQQILIHEHNQIKLDALNYPSKDIS